MHRRIGMKKHKIKAVIIVVVILIILLAAIIGRITISGALCMILLIRFMLPIIFRKNK